MATQLPQNPENLLEQLLCDADLYYLGAKQYESSAEKLFPEFKKSGFVKTRMEWELLQIEFLSKHSFFTETAINEREQQKQQNLQQLKNKLESSLKPHRKEKPIERETPKRTHTHANTHAATQHVTVNAAHQEHEPHTAPTSQTEAAGRGRGGIRAERTTSD